MIISLKKATNLYGEVGEYKLMLTADLKAPYSSSNSVLNTLISIHVLFPCKNVYAHETKPNNEHRIEANKLVAG